MPTVRQMQNELLGQAINDIREFAKKWTDEELELPVVFVVDTNDTTGKAFVKRFLTQEDQYGLEAIRDGGTEAGCVSTVIKAMPVEWADKALEKMAPEGQTLRKVQEPGYVTVILVAFGEVAPFNVKTSG